MPHAYKRIAINVDGRDFINLHGYVWHIPTGHWICFPRKWKRSLRKSFIERHHKPKRKSRGWRKHVRMAKQ